MTIAKLVGKPVYLVSRTNSTNIPGWVLGCATNVFSSFADLKVFLAAMYVGKVKEDS
jgi:hypothetical protein